MTGLWIQMNQSTCVLQMHFDLKFLVYFNHIKASMMDVDFKRMGFNDYILYIKFLTNDVC